MEGGGLREAGVGGGGAEGERERESWEHSVQGRLSAD